MKNILRLTIVLPVLFFSSIISAQKEKDNIWYIGRFCELLLSHEPIPLSEPAQTTGSISKFEFKSYPNIRSEVFYRTPMMRPKDMTPYEQRVASELDQLRIVHGFRMNYHYTSEALSRIVEELNYDEIHGIDRRQYQPNYGEVNRGSLFYGMTSGTWWKFPSLR